MAWIAGYTVHTWELAALRAWAVTFLAATIARHGAPAWLPGPTRSFTARGLAGIAVSITGNETAQRFGRARVVAAAMGAAAVLSLLAGWSRPVSAPLAALCVHRLERRDLPRQLGADRRHGAGGDKELRGATMGLHSMCGYAGGFLGPLGVGVALDLAGPGTLGWALGFGHLAVVTLVGLVVLRRLGRPG